MMTCRDIEVFLLDYLEGHLSATKRIVFVMHLLMCSECREYIRKYKVARELGSRAFEDMKEEPVPEDLVKAVLAAQRDQPLPSES